MAGLAAKNGSNLVEAIQPTTRTRSVRPQEFVPAPKYRLPIPGPALSLGAGRRAETR